MKVNFETEVDDAEDEPRIFVVNAKNTICLWTYEDAPQAYRDVITLPSDIDPDNVFVALVPADYKRDIEHITRDPYFGPKFLDVYTLQDGSTLYVGA